MTLSSKPKRRKASTGTAPPVLMMAGQKGIIMGYEKLFMKYGCPSRDADIRIAGYLVKPESLTRFDEVKHWDSSAMRIISECEATISALQDYRKALAARYGALATMPSHRRLTLERDRGYSGITYYVRQFTVYEDGTENQDDCERFPGKERHKAIARFEELKKLHPDFEAVKDIEKRARCKMEPKR